MVMGDIRPEETLNEVLKRGIEVFKTGIQGITGVLRIGDEALHELDDAMRSKPVAPGETPDETFLNVMALLRGAMEEARTQGSVSAPGVVQKAREALNRVTTAEPSWRPGPAFVRTATDMFRVALRDLRGSQGLLKVATGRGGIDDLETLINWADEVTNRMAKTQEVIAEPKPGKEKTQEVIAEPKPGKSPPTPGKPKRETKSRSKGGKARKMTEKEVRNTVFRAIAEQSGDSELQETAEKVATGNTPAEDFANEITLRLNNGKLDASVMKKAKEKAIQDGVESDHPILKF